MTKTKIIILLAVVASQIFYVKYMLVPHVKARAELNIEQDQPDPRIGDRWCWYEDTPFHTNYHVVTVVAVTNGYVQYKWPCADGMVTQDTKIYLFKICYQKEVVK